MTDLPILRQYQKDAAEYVLSSPENRVGVAIATGLGKTFLARFVIDEYTKIGHRAVFVVPSIELMMQSGRAFNCHNYLGGGRQPNWNSPILISTIQSLANNSEKLLNSQFDILIIDEAHHAIADSYRIITELKPWHKSIFLSATMFRADGRRLKDVVDRVVYERDLHWAIAEGYLAPYKLIRPSSAGSLPLTTETCLATKKDGSQKTIERMSFDHEGRNEIVRDLVRKLTEEHDRKASIMFVNTVDHARKMAEVMGPDWGWCSADRRSDLERFKKHDLKGIISVQLILEGFDYPPADFLVVNGNIKADSTGLIRWIQLLGRVLRLSPGKEFALALDLSVHGLPDVQYRSDLEGNDKDEKDDEDDPLIESMEVIERLEHPMLVTLDDLIQGLRQVNQEYKRLQKELGTRMKLIRRGDVYTVVGTSWRIWRVEHFWRATDGVQQVDGNIQQIEEVIQPAEYKINKKSELTEKQAEILKKFNVKDEVIQGLSRAQASEYIGKLLAEKNLDPATPKQIGFLKWKKVKIPDNLSKDQARKLIAQAVR